MRLLHNVLHRHDILVRDGVGTIILCITRWPRGRVNGATFYPELPGAAGHVIPSARALTEILNHADTALDAMAAIRAAEQEVA